MAGRYTPPFNATARRTTNQQREERDVSHTKQMFYKHPAGNPGLHAGTALPFFQRQRYSKNPCSKTGRDWKWVSFQRQRRGPLLA